MLDIGTGPPLVLIPGIQGRWEWIAPTAQALARTFRVLAVSLPGERGSGCPHDPSLGFELFLRQVDSVLDRAGAESAVICGVSFGGLVGAAYAAGRPGRIRALVLASTPGPRWKPDARVQRYVNAPLASTPAFVARAAGRLYPEVAAARPAWGPRFSFLTSHLGRILAARISPRRMADRIMLAADVDFVSVCRRITAPTLVVAGEPELDRVVPVDGMKDYVELIADARMITMARTGHIGMVTQAGAFAEVVNAFCPHREVVA
ncbi:MAG: alpha/beta hydrolase [Acidobacteria bacterium]|nr:alpha/beta hydrolase [Acidobacteriota bacterium]